VSIISHYRQCSSVENRPQTGRPPILSRRAKWVLFKNVNKSRNAPLQEITNTFNQGRSRWVSQRTIWCVLREEGYQRRVIRKAIRLRVPNRRNRLAWCRGKLHLPVTVNWVVGQSCI